MAWPTTAISTANLDAASDTPAAARADLYSAVVAINDMMAARGQISGVAAIESDGYIDSGVIPAQLESVAGDMNLVPASDRVNVFYILGLQPRSTTQLAAISAVEGDVAYCSDGDTGSPCLAVFDGTSWLRVSLGAAISAT
jgi:hypothetical protein